MDETMIALLSLVLGLVGAIVGSFAYLMGEIRKMGAASRRDLENARDYLNGRIEAMQRTEANERTSLRSEFVSSTGRVENDLRRLGETVARRPDMDALEQRLTRGMERLESKVDVMMVPRREVTKPLRQTGD